MVLRAEVIPSDLLRSFLVIERTGSFTDAAALLGLSQPAISAQMKRLQQMVGGELFDRSASRLGLTPRGQNVKHYAMRILNLNWQVLRLCGGGDKTRTFRIGIQNVFAPTHLARLQQNLDRRLNDQRAIITWSMGNELLADVKAGYSDAAFVVRAEAEADQLQNCREEEMCWVCSPRFVLGEGRPIPLISWPNSLADKLAISELSKRDLSYSVNVVGHDLTTLLESLRAGIGVVILPKRIVPADLRVADFHYLPRLPKAVSGICVNEGIPAEEANLLRDAIGEAMRDETLPVHDSASPRVKKVFI